MAMLAQRVCPCHGKKVSRLLEFDYSGRPRYREFCTVDPFDLGYDGGVDKRDWDAARRVNNARLWVATGRDAHREGA